MKGEIFREVNQGGRCLMSKECMHATADMLAICL